MPSANTGMPSTKCGISIAPGHAMLTMRPRLISVRPWKPSWRTMMRISGREILNRAAWNGEDIPTDEGLVEQLKERALQIDKEHEPKFITVEELTERLKPAEKEYRPMTEEGGRNFKELIAQIEADRK